MKYGMNMLLWSTDVTGPEYDPIFEQLARLGYDGVEIPIFNPDSAAYARLGQRLDALGLERTAVTVRTAAENPISPDAGVRRRGIQQMGRVLESCEALGAHLLVGPHQAALGEFSGKPPSAAEWSLGVESMRGMCELAALHDVTLAVEPLNRFEIYFINSARDGARFVREVNHPRCRLMFDTFHAHIEEKNSAAAIKDIASVLVHVHISENDRSTPGAGQVHWTEVFEALHRIQYQGWLTIEAFGTRLPELAAATRIWRRMFTSEERLAEDGLAFLRKSWDATALAASWTPPPRQDAHFLSSRG